MDVKDDFWLMFGIALMLLGAMLLGFVAFNALFIFICG
jgi:hypothetical protein